MDAYHKAVLVEEVLKYLDPKAGKVYVDATFGGGGHSQAILEKEPNCKLISIDWDEDALALNSEPLKKKFDDHFIPLYGNFALLDKLLKKIDIDQIDGLLVDFGPSQYQILEKEGFSFRKESKLDMRMAPKYQKFTAYDLINRASPKELEFILKTYGEEPFAKRIVKAIIEARRKKRIKTTKELAELVKDAIPYKKNRIHPATKTFQALRIAINNELNNIKSLFGHVLKFLVPKGRLVCISFHSLEDRLVKQFFKDHKNDFEILTKKIITASPEEKRINPSSRSAKLRAAIRL